MRKPIYWNEEKCEQLRHRYGIGFEEIIVALDRGSLLDNRKHPNAERYKHQRQMIVKIEDYAIVVSYVEDKDKIFLKTLFPSRQATQEYLTNPTKS